MNKKIWYVDRISRETNTIENKINSEVFGPFESTYELIIHYSTHLLKWDLDRLEYTDTYFKQVYNKGYYDFLIENNHIFVFDKEPLDSDLQNIKL